MGEYDDESEKVAMRAFLQGAMLIQTLSQGPTAPIRGIVKVKDIEQGVDSDGIYLPYFTVVTESGHRFRVTIEAE